MQPITMMAKDQERPAKRRRRILPLLILCISTGLLAIGTARRRDIPVNSIKLPPGFSISIFASGIENARSMTLGSNGTLFVSTRTAGSVYAVVDRHNR